MFVLVLTLVINTKDSPDNLLTRERREAIELSALTKEKLDKEIDGVIAMKTGYGVSVSRIQVYKHKPSLSIDSDGIEKRLKAMIERANMRKRSSKKKYAMPLESEEEQP
jgi:hypothetical protein